MEVRDVSAASELIDELEKLYQQGDRVFRGQHNSNFLLLPSAFREPVIKKRMEQFPATSFYQQWCSSQELRERIFPPFKQDYINSLHVRRIVSAKTTTPANLN